MKRLATDFLPKFLHAPGTSRSIITSQTRRLSSIRPDIDFDYLLDDANLEAIKKNIAERKGVGDIEALRSKWSEVQSLVAARDKPAMEENTYKAMWDELYNLALSIPNMSHPDSPKGGEDNMKTISEFGVKREGSLLTAEQLVGSWRALHFPNDAAGERSYSLVGPLANLEKAILDYVTERVSVLGFKPVSVPDLVSTDVTEACGVHQTSMKNIQYMVEGEPKLALSGTAEMGISAFLRGRTFEEEQLPIRLVATSRCYRPEISKSASEAKLYRVHEFTKVEYYTKPRNHQVVQVEMFSVCTPEQSAAELDFLVDIQKGTFESMGLHCRLQEMPTEELGAPAHRKFDVEAWMPGRALWGEISSASNCTDFQSRRLGIQYKKKDGTKGYVHTCNGTAIASTRAIIALLETFQTDKKGLLDLPDCIRNRLKTQRPQPLRFHVAKNFV